MSLMQALKAQRHNVRDYGMYIAFIAIVIFFAIATEGLFVSSRNIGNLMNAMSYIAVLAVGMTLVIVIRHIDLSVGFLAGTLGAVAAISLKFWHLPVGLSILLVLLLFTIFWAYHKGMNWLINVTLIFFLIFILIRYFDLSWKLLDRSLFFILGGVILLIIGFFMEQIRRKLTSEEKNEN